MYAAVPALLGFYPERSLVLLGLGGRGEVVAVGRHDLLCGSERRASMRESVERFAVPFRDRNLAAAAALVVDDEAEAHAADHDAVASLFLGVMASAGAQWAVAYATTEIRAGARWWCLSGQEPPGTVGDPRASAVTVARVLAGRPIQRSRGELRDLVAGSPRERLEVAALIDAAQHSADLEFSLGLPRDQGGGYRRRKVALLLRQIDCLAAGEQLLPVELAELGIALQDTRIRDTMLALAVGEVADAAERMWLLLTRALPAPERADAAVLLGFHAYLRGEGALARVALDVALDADPEHRLAALISASVDRGLHPGELAVLADTGRRVGMELGASLPPAPRPV